MARRRGSKADGGSWTEADLDAVWAKGQVIPGKDSAKFRKDACGATMQRSKHGDTSDTYGWEVDHIKPVEKGGKDGIDNLQPLQWQNNRLKGDGPLACAVTT